MTEDTSSLIPIKAPTFGWPGHTVERSPLVERGHQAEYEIYLDGEKVGHVYRDDLKHGWRMFPYPGYQGGMPTRIAAVTALIRNLLSIRV